MNAKLELWGGLECSVARIGNDFRDQFKDTGHYARLSDLDAIAALGIRTLRYPILWESVAPDHPDQCDWSWHDERMAHLKSLDITTIVGLVHHGSGPRYTNLLDPGFAAGLARHAERVARRYPWITMFTPVNEPLTTARFSGLYGHWYPHGRSYRKFLPILVNEIRATQLAMQAIRTIIPHAQLVQTEDLGKTFSTPHLTGQAAHENERRWLGFDLLCGYVRPDHPFWTIMHDNGVALSELTALHELPCPPDIIGMNHYLTSERYLDENVALYPSKAVGGNGRDVYADIEAVRADLPDLDRGPAARLREVWARYRIPLAITEAHLGCTRDEQLRWLKQMWDAAAEVRAEGVEIRAVTMWSMFGAVDWNTLLTTQTGFYEPGAFDTRGETARLTALAKAATQLTEKGEFDHPALDGIGWWQRDDRYLVAKPRQKGLGSCATLRPILIVGDGRLGRAVAQACDARSLAYALIGNREEQERDGMDRLIDASRPWAIVNCSGFSAAACARSEPERCVEENVTIATALATRAASLGLPYVTISTDLVFDGRHNNAYIEPDLTQPLGLFGITKRDAEVQVMHAHAEALILRTGPLFGTTPHEMLAAALRHAARDAGVNLDRDLIVSPTYIPDLADALLDLLIDGESGLWHLVNDGSVSADELLRRFARDADHPFEPTGRSGCNLALTSKRGLLLPKLATAFDRYSAAA